MKLVRKVTRIKPELARALAELSERQEISEARILAIALKEYVAVRSK